MVWDVSKLLAVPATIMDSNPLEAKAQINPSFQLSGSQPA